LFESVKILPVVGKAFMRATDPGTELAHMFLKYW
jgi:hypothetical protein